MDLLDIEGFYFRKTKHLEMLEQEEQVSSMFRPCEVRVRSDTLQTLTQHSLILWFGSIRAAFKESHWFPNKFGNHVFVDNRRGFSDSHFSVVILRCIYAKLKI